MRSTILSLVMLLAASMASGDCVTTITPAPTPFAPSASGDSKIDCDATAGTTNINLPTAVSAGNGRVIVVKKEDSSYNCCDVSVTGGGLIDGVSTKSICIPNHALGFFSDAAQWHIGPSYILPPLPVGSYSDNSNQTLASTTTGQVVTFNTNEFQQFIEHSTSVNTGRVTIDVPGTYAIMISALLNSSTNNRTGWVWLKVNGVDVPRSNTQVKIGTNGIASVIAVPFMVDLVRGDYFEIWFGGDNTSLFLQAVAAVPTPTPNSHPAVPSIIMSVNMISRSPN